jgi:hypothetical protein
VSILAALFALAFVATALVGVVAPTRLGAVRALASPLGCGLASAGAFLVFLRSLGDAPADSEATLALALAAAAAVCAAAAVESTVVTRVRQGARVAWVSVAGGLALLAALAWLGKGSLLRWSLALTAGEARVELQGAALVLGVALLAALLGTLALTASLLSRDVGWARVLGQRALLLASGLAFLGLALAVFRAARLAPEAIVSAAVPLAALWGAGVLLTAALVWLLEGPGPSLERLVAPDFGAALAVLALAAGGYEAWSSVGSYQTTGTLALAAIALLGLSAAQPTRLELTRRLVFLAALLAVFA